MIVGYSNEYAFDSDRLDIPIIISLTTSNGVIIKPGELPQPITAMNVRGQWSLFLRL